jgi:hypothetical protein
VSEVGHPIHLRALGIALPSQAQAIGFRGIASHGKGIPGNFL